MTQVRVVVAEIAAEASGVKTADEIAENKKIKSVEPVPPGDGATVTAAIVATRRSKGKEVDIERVPKEVMKKKEAAKDIEKEVVTLAKPRTKSIQKDATRVKGKSGEKAIKERGRTNGIEGADRENTKPTTVTVQTISSERKQQVSKD